ncbi:MAG: ABC transporter substrate-binding protein [Burkholderiales bacterium]
MIIQQPRPVLFMVIRVFVLFLCLQPSFAAGEDVVRRIGYIAPDREADTAPWVSAFRERLRELGYAEGKNVVIHSRYADYNLKILPELANELVALNVEVIVADSTPAALAANHSTAAIPIVFPAVSDPIAVRLVKSLARPGANVTGFSVMSPDLAGKRLGPLREMDPRIRRVAMLLVPENPTSAIQGSELQAAAHALKLKLIPVLIRQPEDIDRALRRLAGRADALFLTDDALLDGHRNQIGEYAIKHRLPTLCGYRPPKDTTCLMWYGPDLVHQYKSAAEYVAKILGGVKPADLPVQQPTKFAFVINGRTAKALRIKIPQSFVLSADAIIN